MKLLRPCALFALFACALSCVDIFKEKKAEEDTQKQASVSIIGVDGITSSSATLSASLASIGTSKVTQKGFCWSSTNGTPTLSDKSTNQGPADGPCSFSYELASLAPETKYYCRAYAVNAAGVAYSDVKSFTTLESYKVLAAYGFDNSDADDDYADYDGVALGEVKFIDDTPGKSGKALFLNGMKGGFVNIPYNPFKGTENFSVALWIKDFTSGVLLYGKSSSQFSHDNPWINLGDDDYFQFSVDGGWSASSHPGAFSFSYPYTVIQSSSWHHLVFTCSKKTSEIASLSLYVDGKLVDNGEAKLYLRYDTYGITTIVIGGDRGGDYRAPTMKIDELILFGEALSPSKVARIYENRGATRF